MDNGTMVETFKYLNYCQLAKNSLVSKKFRNLIQTHRHKLAFLYVNSIDMTNFHTFPSLAVIFDQKLSAEEYNEWVTRSGYSKQIPFEDLAVGEQSEQHDPEVHMLRANAFYNYKDKISFQSSDPTTALFAQTKLINEHWPLYQHFIHLLMDPFIYIRSISLIPQDDVLNLLAGAFNPDGNRLQWKNLNLSLKGNVPKFINWAKNHIFCDVFAIEYKHSDHDKQLLDLFVTGANCTSEINTTSYYRSSQLIVNFVKKFVDLKSSDEWQVVESIRGMIDCRIIEVLKRDYAECVVKEEKDEDDYITEYAFELINNDVGKKLQLTIKLFDCDDEFVLSINNL